jgi:tetratricopeptide (TPR) repeat protein
MGSYNPTMRIRGINLGLAMSAILGVGCAGAYRQGEQAARRGDWDAAIEYYRQALREEPRRAEYRMTLERAMRDASWAHIDAARGLEDRGALEAARAEYQKAEGFDPSNRRTIERLATIDRELRSRLEGKPAGPLATPPGRGRAPVGLSSAERLRLQFTDASLREVLDFIGEAAGIHVVYDAQFQDRRVTVKLDDATVEHALDIILRANGLSYKIIAPSDDLAP